MRYTIPHYYGSFQCSASKCPDTCCASWQIQIDEKTLNKYKKVKGSFGNRLYNSIDWNTSSYKQYEGNCCFLDEDKLCDIYNEAGVQMMCKTCKSYPRHIEEFKGVKEFSLSLSCPEAAAMILGCEEMVGFLSKEKEEIEKGYEEFDSRLFTKLMRTRDVMIGIMQNRELDCSLRMGMITALGHDVQERIDRDALDAVEELLMRYNRKGAHQSIEQKLVKHRNQVVKRYGLMQRMFGIFDKFKVLRPGWTDRISGFKNTLYLKGSKDYEENRYRFKAQMKTCCDNEIRMESYWEQLMVYFLYTYFCGAVYDGQAFAKMKVALVSTLMIQEMLQAEWQQTGELTFSQLTETVWKYSRELEHLDSNLNRLERMVSVGEIFELENLICCIMN